jgi:hypothetical protein
MSKATAIPALAEASRRAGFRVAVRERGAKPMSREIRLTLAQAARHLQITTRLMRRIADEGRVPYVTIKSQRGCGISRHWRLFLPSDLDKVLVEVPCRAE